MFFKEKKGDTKTSDLARVAALLIHAAKIDENFSKEEEVIISKALLKIGADQDNLENILKEGKKIEENSNQFEKYEAKAKLNLVNKIYGTFDENLNQKYKVQLNKKTIDRVKNSF